MGDDNSVPVRPMANTVNAAKEGQIAIAMKPEEFIYIDRDCEYFKRVIQRIQTIMDGVSQQQHWGLGENNPDMISARTLVERFKQKARGADNGNSVWQIMENHYQIVEDIQEFHRIARERMMQADSDFAAQFTQLNETLPQRAPVAAPLGPHLIPGGLHR